MNLIDTFFNIDVLQRVFPLLLKGLWITVQVGLCSIVLGLVGGMALALARLYAVAPVRVAARVYVDILRSIPLLVLLILIYYALPFVGLRLTPFWASVTALSLVSSSYTAEIFRSGIEAIAKGQFEASDALGLSWGRKMTDVILPQAIRIVIPSLTNNCINVVKDTALASVVAMPDLLKQATQAQALTANPSPLVGAAIIYVALLWPLVAMVTSLEQRFAGRQR